LPSWLANVLGIYFTSRHSDDTGERYLHMAIPCFIAAASLVGAMLAGATPLGLVLLIVLGGALGCALAPYWAIPSDCFPLPSTNRHQRDQCAGKLERADRPHSPSANSRTPRTGLCPSLCPLGHDRAGRRARDDRPQPGGEG
jgi:hypothetical protein